MGAYQSTLAGWAVVCGLIAIVVRSNWQKARTAQPVRIEAPRGRQDRPSVTKDVKPKENKPKESKPKETKPKETKPKETKPKENKQKQAKKQNKAAPAPAPAPAPAAPAPKSKPSTSPSSDDDRASDLEFARQLVSVKQGTKFTGKAKDENRQKSVKQSRAEEGRISTPSSTAGIDADDDRSSAAASPALGPTEAGNVDDMLEKAAPGPSVLRLTAAEQAVPAKSQKPKAPAAPVETKKQRQNRQKAELAKAQREEEEKERKVKLEAQRRLAREAEGRAAKDGSAFMAAQAQKNSAWTAANGTNGAAAAPAVVQPLDTFEAKPVAAAVEPKAAEPKAANDEWITSLPSEEEQMEKLLEGEWSTVKPKSRKAKKQEKETEAAEVSAAAPASKPVAAATPAVIVKTTILATKSSFGVLQVDSTPDDQEEMEWDV